MLSDIDMRHRIIRVRRLKGSLETTQAFVEHRGKPVLSDYSSLKAYFGVRIDDGSHFLFTGHLSNCLRKCRTYGSPEVCSRFLTVAFDSIR